MITLKSSHEIDLMRRSGKITAAARALAGEMVKPGVTTQEINDAVERFIRKQGAVPSFLHYNGSPASVCISVNDEIIHGIPSKKRVLQEGDIVYLEKKKKKADKPNYDHVVQVGESMHSIAQMYGIQIKSLYKMNKKDKDYIPEEGDVLKLR